MTTEASRPFSKKAGAPPNPTNTGSALTPEEFAEFIDSPEPVDAHVETGELDEEPVPSKMVEGSSPPLGAP